MRSLVGSRPVGIRREGRPRQCSVSLDPNDFGRRHLDKVWFQLDCFRGIADSIAISLGFQICLRPGAKVSHARRARDGDCGHRRQTWALLDQNVGSSGCSSMALV